MARLDFDRWDYAATKLLLLVGLLGVPLVVVGLPLAAWAGGDALVWPAVLEEQARVTSPALRDGASAAWDGGAEVTLADASGMLWLLTLLPALVVAAAAPLVTGPLLGLVRTIQRGESFSDAAVRRLRVVGLTLLLAPWAHHALTGIANAAVLEEAFGQEFWFSVVIPAGTLAISALGLALGAVAEAFRQGARLRDDVEGLV